MAQDRESRQRDAKERDEVAREIKAKMEETAVGTARQSVVPLSTLESEIAHGCAEVMAQNDDYVSVAIRHLSDVLRDGKRYTKFILAIGGMAKSAMTHIGALMLEDARKSPVPNIQAVDQVRSILGDFRNSLLRIVYMKHKGMFAVARELRKISIETDGDDESIRAELGWIDLGLSELARVKEAHELPFKQREQKVPRLFGYETPLYAANRSAYTDVIFNWVCSIDNEWREFTMQMGVSDNNVAADLSSTSPLMMRSPLMEVSSQLDSDVVAIVGTVPEDDKNEIEDEETNKRRRDVSLASTVDAAVYEGPERVLDDDELPMQLKRFEASPATQVEF